jgi:alkylation response protein AidB-like acyl-CoA dehydrogenase
MDEFLTEEGKKMRDNVRSFMERINPEMYSYAEKAEFPYHLIPEIAKLGIVGADCPKDVGGKGMSCVDVGASMYELACKDASISTFFLLHHSLGNYTVLKLA